MKRSLVIHVAVALLIGAVSSAGAHHSHPYFYDQCRTVTIEGRVESVRWVDPHISIVVRLDDGTAHTIDWIGLRSLANRGNIAPAEAALAAGARIAVAGSPIRSSAEIRKYFPDYTHEVNPNTIDPTLIRLLDGSWTWARTPADRMPTPVQPSCADLTTK